MNKPTAKSGETGKIAWLSVIQGWAILLVIVGHVNPFTYSGVENEFYPFGELIHRFCYSFHMPLFMFVSGGLLHATRISRGFTTRRLYADKFKRLVLPFIFFTIVALAIKIPLSSFAKRGIELSVESVAGAFWDPANGPLSELWFIGTLIWLMALYPLYVYISGSIWREAALLLITAIPPLLGLEADFRGWLNLAALPQYAFYLVAGMLFFKYHAIRLLESRIWITFLLTAAFFLLFFFLPLQFPLALLGILCSFGWGAVAARRFPKLFGSFRDYSFQIFLIGIFPQMFIELIIWKHFHAGWMQVPFYLASCTAGIYAGCLMGKMAKKIPWGTVRAFFGIK